MKLSIFANSAVLAFLTTAVLPTQSLAGQSPQVHPRQRLQVQLDPFFETQEAAQAAEGTCDAALMAELQGHFHDWFGQARNLYYNGETVSEFGPVALETRHPQERRQLVLEDEEDVKKDDGDEERQLWTWECLDWCELHRQASLQWCIMSCIICETCTCPTDTLFSSEVLLLCYDTDDADNTRKLRGNAAASSEQEDSSWATDLPSAATIERFERFVGLYMETRVNEWDSELDADERACLGEPGKIGLTVKIVFG